MLFGCAASSSHVKTPRRFERQSQLNACDLQMGQKDNHLKLACFRFQGLQKLLESFSVVRGQIHLHYEVAELKQGTHLQHKKSTHQ